ncbi:PilT protein domain-containing protein [Thioalkalivibrio nitratireducens DSM 14787]|uniref:PilT protein domain-containing protein n=1 Tax=Thioalkalivibrio nitratireducens (strain DSM 14787 / UNIQEM 213 / ALEN2) TaxID=1255043 RepID=L0DTP7_THIND|nr:type II toxin-antitoxin system VapC family toxin [Thioalkalivibrio nitratireducens]AGA31751.1 PilT protein domain-containing protein [Thioalkalivibrio nitratireducens DSM 14787]
MRTVLDASAAVHMVMRTERSGEFIDRLETSQMVLAPALFHGEVANTLWKYTRAGVIDKNTALTRLEEALSLVDAFEPDANLATEALSLAILHNHPVYDLIYVVLAMRFGARLLSADGGLLQLAAGIDPSMA